MDEILAAAGALAAASLAALVPIALRVLAGYADLAQQRALEVVQARLGEGAARIAGEIAGQIAASPEVKAASRAMLDTGARVLAGRFADTMAKRGIPVDTLRGMIAGELGKRGIAIER